MTTPDLAKECERWKAEATKWKSNFGALADHHGANECSILGAAMCPEKDLLHFDDDGCPSCCSHDDLVMAVRSMRDATHPQEWADRRDALFKLVKAPPPPTEEQKRMDDDFMNGVMR